MQDRNTYRSANRSANRSGREDYRKERNNAQDRQKTFSNSGTGRNRGREENRNQDEDRNRYSRREDSRGTGFRDGEPDENRIEGRNAVIEAYRAGRTIEKIFLLEGPAEGAMQTVLRLAKEKHTPIRFLSRQRLDQMSQTGKHQGVIAQAAAFRYSEMEDLFARAAEKGEDPFFVLLDQIEDPHNLGAIIRTANLAGAHGVIIPKDRAAFVCADMGGTPMTRLSMTGPIGLVIGAEGSGVSRLVKEKCDMTAAIPMKGEIDSLNASVAAGVLMYEIVRQREAAAAKGL